MPERKNAYDREDLLECGYHGFAGPGTAQLPVPPMLMFDRIDAIYDDGGDYGKGYVEASLDVHPDLWFFDCHFPNDPVMPGSLGVDALWQLIGYFLTWSGHPGRGRALGSKEVKFAGQVTPDVTSVRYRVDIRRVMTRPMFLGIADGLVFADDRQIYSAKDLRVGLFTDAQLAGGLSV